MENMRTKCGQLVGGLITFTLVLLERLVRRDEGERGLCLPVHVAAFH